MTDKKWKLLIYLFIHMRLIKIYVYWYNIYYQILLNEKI